MRVLGLALLLLAGEAACAETVDRIVLVVARHPVTELQLEEELRITSFLNDQPLSVDLTHRQQAASRLVDQALIEREMILTHFPFSTDEEIDTAFNRLVDEQGGEDRFSQALDRYQLTRSEVHTHLALQIATLRFIAFRFRPEMGIQEDAVRQAYEQEKSSWQAEHPGILIPTFDSSRSSLRHQLLEQQTDSVMSAWLEQARKQVRIAFLDHALEAPPR